MIGKATERGIEYCRESAALQKIFSTSWQPGDPVVSWMTASFITHIFLLGVSKVRRIFYFFFQVSTHDRLVIGIKLKKRSRSELLKSIGSQSDRIQIDDTSSAVNSSRNAQIGFSQHKRPLHLESIFRIMVSTGSLCIIVNVKSEVWTASSTIYLSYSPPSH